VEGGRGEPQSGDLANVRGGVVQPQHQGVGQNKRGLTHGGVLTSFPGKRLIRKGVTGGEKVEGKKVLRGWRTLLFKTSVKEG